MSQKILIGFAFISIIVSSCKSDEVLNSSEIIITSGENQVGINGEYLNDPLIVKINSSFPASDLALYIIPKSDGFAIAENGGSNNPVLLGEYPVVSIADDYKTRIFFRLGCFGDQKFEIILKLRKCIFDDSCPILASKEVIFTSESSKTNWDKICAPKGIKFLQQIDGQFFAWVSDQSGNTGSSLFQSNDLINWSKIYEDQFKVYDFKPMLDGFAILTDKGFHTSGNGQSWIHHANGLPEVSFGIKPNHLLVEDTVIFASYNAISENSSNGAVYRSRDQGLTWKKVYGTYAFSTLTRSSSGLLYLYDWREYLLVSNNSGTSWQSLSHFGIYHGEVTIAVSYLNNILIVVEERVIRNQQLVSNDKLYDINLTTEFSDEIIFSEELEYNDITDLKVFNGIPYLLADGIIYKKTSEWEPLSSPSSKIPESNQIVFPSGFDKLLIVAEEQFVLFGIDSYTNLLD